MPRMAVTAVAKAPKEWRSARGLSARPEPKYWDVSNANAIAFSPTSNACGHATRGIRSSARSPIRALMLVRRDAEVRDTPFLSND